MKIENKKTGKTKENNIELAKQQTNNKVILKIQSAASKLMGRASKTGFDKKLALSSF
ncbi:MAG: hypothetical protein HC905_26585 [Bacteroidales bacterium]|nr:hypothetical protein [Bacteroidales bacterium]